MVIIFVVPNLLLHCSNKIKFSGLTCLLLKCEDIIVCLGVEYSKWIKYVNSDVGVGSSRFHVVQDIGSEATRVLY